MTSREETAPGLGIHSLDLLGLKVPDLAVARSFFETFGLNVRDGGETLSLYTFGHAHKWANIEAGPRKELAYIAFGAFPDDLPRFAKYLEKAGISFDKALYETSGILEFKDIHGVSVKIQSAEKSSPDRKAPATLPSENAIRGAPLRSDAKRVRPRRLSHVLLFTPDINASIEFYSEVLGLRLSDHPGPVAFLHGIHGSDHHLIAFAQSTGTGYHHSSWDVGSIDDVGLGAQQMISAGHRNGWGVGRHVLGSNYFYYVQDPWGSFAEYSYDIDFIPAEMNWQPGRPSPENSLYLWGPEPPNDFVVNYEANEAAL